MEMTAVEPARPTTTLVFFLRQQLVLLHRQQLGFGVVVQLLAFGFLLFGLLQRLDAAREVVFDLLQRLSLGLRQTEVEEDGS